MGNTLLTFFKCLRTPKRCCRCWNFIFVESCLELLVMLAGKREREGWSFRVTGMTQDFNEAPKGEVEREWKASCDLSKWVKSEACCLQAPNLLATS